MQRVPEYPDIFNYRKTSVFSETAQKSIGDLGFSFQKKAVTAQLISNFRSSLRETPAESIPRGSREIRQVAQFYQHYHYQGPSGIGSSFLQALGLKRTNIDSIFQEYPDLGWLLIFHGNGYIREAAMKALTTPPSCPFELAAVVYRLNDWVENVRSASVIYARKFLPMMKAEIISDSAFFLLSQLSVLNRWDGAAISVVNENIYRPDVLNKLKERFIETCTGKVSLSLRQILKQSNFDGCLNEVALNAKLPNVRAVAIETLLMERARWLVGYRKEWVDKVYGVTRRVAEFKTRDVKVDYQQMLILPSAAQDKSYFVRRVAADFLVTKCQNMTPQMIDVLDRLSDDKSTVVRARIEFIRSKLGKL
jgi:hypothetical protein